MTMQPRRTWGAVNALFRGLILYGLVAAVFVLATGAGAPLYAQVATAGVVQAAVTNQYVSSANPGEEHSASGLTGTVSALATKVGQRNEPNGVIGSASSSAGVTMTLDVDPLSGHLSSVSAAGNATATVHVSQAISAVPFVQALSSFELVFVVDNQVAFTATGSNARGLGLQPEIGCNPFPDVGEDPCAGAQPAINTASGVLSPGEYHVVGDAGVSFACCQDGSASHGFSFTVNFTPRRPPVLILPGIGATYAANPSNDLFWLTHRGANPGELRIDPLSRAYDDLVQTFKKVGYKEFQDLFVVNYDWRLPPGPDDGTVDGQISGLTAESISRGQITYGVDYLGRILREAAETWAVVHPGEPPLDAVDVVAHSTGGLVARTYIQSAAYGGEYAPGKNLPKINNLIMVGVPNRGASKAWNPLHDNWVVEPSFQMVLSKIINRAYQKVLHGDVIVGPDHDISLASIQPPQCQDLPHVCFVNQYVPTARALLATYDFIDFGLGVTNVNNFPELRNSLLLDLNAGLDRVNVVGDPNAFAAQATVTVMYGTNGGDTPVQALEEIGPTKTLVGFHPIAQFPDFVGRDARFGETYYSDVKAPESGDGTVPLESSIGQFLFDSRVTLEPFTNGVNTSGSVGHADLMFNSDVQKAILTTLGVAFHDPADISTGLNGPTPAVACAVSGCLNVIFDPVEGFVVDGQGRRLGFSAATGPVTEIPGSVWFGNSDGIGWVFGPIVEPLSLQLAGLGQDYYVEVSVMSPARVGGMADSRFLALGAQQVLPIPMTPTTTVPDGVPPVTAAAPSPPPNAAGWNNTAVSVALSATDNAGGSGVRDVTYSISGPQPLGNTTVPGASATIGIVTDGRTTVTAFASDNAGNAEPPQTISVNLDKTPPVVTASRAPLPNVNGWNSTSVVVSFQCSDSVSGLAPGNPPADRTVSGEGANQTVVGTCHDIAGNSASIAVDAINIDVTPPSLVMPANQTATQTSPAGAAITYPSPAISDAGSGVAASSCVPVSGSVFAVGSTTVTCSATDRAGNARTGAFTVTVTSNDTLDGRMYGVGHIEADRQHHHFVFRVSRLHSREIGRLEYWVNDPRVCRTDDDYDRDRDFDGDHDDNYRRDHRDPRDRFEATSIDAAIFSDDPAFQPGRQPPTVDTVRFAGTGKWNGRSGYTFEALATDQGEPGRRRDSFTLVIKDPRGNIVANVNGKLDGGNIQSTRVRR